MSRVFRGLNQLSDAFVEAIEIEVAAQHAAAALAAHILHEKAINTFGDVNKLAPLAQATQDDRISKKFTPNDPLLRDGRLLRDHVENRSPRRKWRCRFVGRNPARSRVWLRQHSHRDVGSSATGVSHGDGRVRKRDRRTRPLGAPHYFRRPERLC